MSRSLKPYLDSIRSALETSLCLRNFPSQICERHNKPEVELRTSTELLHEPILLKRSDNEKCLIESSVNSARISFRFKFEDADPIEEILGKKFLGFLMRRAEDYFILRRVPIPGYSLSFLITNKHLNRFSKQKIIEFIIFFIQEADKEISSLKIAMNARGRSVANEYMKLYE